MSVRTNTVNPLLGAVAAIRRALKHGCTVVACALAATQLVACAGDVARPPETTRIEHTPTEPMVVSSHPLHDAAIHQQTETQLSAADWAVLETLGPRPIWDQIQLRHRQRAHPIPTGPEATRLSGPRARRAPATGTVSAVEHDFPGAPATTAPTTGPTSAPAPVPPPIVIDESTLPVEIADLADGKVRIIWDLRSYGGTTITAADVDAGTSRRKITAAPPDLAPLIAAITPYLGAGGTALPLPRENRIVITCDRAARNSVLDLLDKIDVPPRQVEITAKIFEVSRDFDFQQGAQVILKRIAADSSQTLISTFDTKRFLDSVGNQPFQGSVLSLMKVFQDAGISLDASFQLLADGGMINVVSSPRMTVAEGQTGYMLAGQELPIQSSTIANGTTTVATQYKPVGVQLYITPQVISDERIKLHTISIVSSVSGFAPLPMLNGGHSGQDVLINPIIDSREAETAVTIDDRATLVISGLRMIRTTVREEKVPGLGDIPGLGWLFKNHRSQQQVTDLYFFVTPTLL